MWDTLYSEQGAGNESTPRMILAHSQNETWKPKPVTHATYIQVISM